MAASTEQFDLVVVGAGWFGLAATKTYLEVHPDARVVLLEAESSVGGVWGKNRLYPGLKSNNMVGTYEFSDFPMDEKTWGVKPGQHIPGQTLHNYLTAYAKKFNVLPRVRFNCKVESVERGEKGGWILKTSANAAASMVTKKLVVATGVTSQAFLPTFEGQESFGEPLFHSKDFLAHADTIKTKKRVTILGGTKSAWDAVYAYAIEGVEIDWVIRESGHGPCWMAPPYVTPLKKWLEKLAHVRFLTWMSPCIWGEADGYGGIRSWLHGTAVGRFLVDRFWAILGGDLVTLNKYDSHPETAKLKPWIGAFWTGTSLSILNYDTDFFELVKGGKIKVHIADITQLSKGKVHLSSGEVLESETLLCSTGWKHSTPFTFIPSGLESELGLPHVQTSEVEPLTEQVDAEILSLYPRLAKQPKKNEKFKPLCDTKAVLQNEESLSALNLYRFMVPANAELLATNDIAFAGNLMAITTAIIAQTQALWITAYFDGKMLPFSATIHSTAELDERVTALQHSATLHNRFGKWRYPGGWCGKIPDFVFDALPYVDLLLKDLDLKTRRKGGWLKEISEPYGPEDYPGIVQEWLDKDKKDL
ncbi:hypothetical protein BJ875DRAFT_485775 [Amylocarpus encephaloides]|uniref:FAD/NAD(P)-binding domain-containing protein n=1 Tax=Amylocarpus encephaloides TaxID=45428 RepID=A0A9P8C3M9_9HELO|nr:hypothetical protein BJ875DRAFT_485775 [Amylocarpus encephaloides]